jgi:hypothetical protein
VDVREGRQAARQADAAAIPPTVRPGAAGSGG